MSGEMAEIIDMKIELMDVEGVIENEINQGLS